MTADQALALGMPFITAALFGLTALFVRKPWNERKRQATPTPLVDGETVERVTRLLQRAERELHPYL